MKPFVKWVGGKRQLMNKIIEYMPSSYEGYFEPFVGGGALFFNLAPKEAFINDYNEELINVYNIIKSSKLPKMLITIDKHAYKNSKEYFYMIRNLDRDLSVYSKLTNVDRAARFMYLNKACFNGMYRVNRNNQFNVPFNNKININVYDTENINKISDFLNINKISITSGDFEKAVLTARKDDFVYFDPPYDVPEESKSFTSYTNSVFGRSEQKRLFETYKRLSDAGVKVMLSNHNTEFIRELYNEFDIKIVKANRMINSNGKKRGKVEEVIIINYDL